MIRSKHGAGYGWWHRVQVQNWLETCKELLGDQTPSEKKFNSLFTTSLQKAVIRMMTRLQTITFELATLLISILENIFTWVKAIDYESKGRIILMFTHFQAG